MPNRLANSQSLYLRKHANNPIDWWPWCDAALETAKAQDKPIFLSIGYSSCHWCTVMEGEAFSDPAIAQYMNENFLPVKVDREERPDLDSIYMQTLQMMTGQGGWPLNVFLTPEDLIPFYGGTYFPLDPKYGRPGFLQVLQAIRRFYDTEKVKLNSVKGEILGNLQQSTLLPSSQISEDLLQQGMQTTTGILVSVGHGPSFPMIPYAEFTLRGMRFNFENKYDTKQACTQRGLNLALGGIYDHVGGGFHRYTVDPTWTVPHFEKMLYDNGQIVEYLANLWSAGIEEPAFERAVAGTVAWLQREMTAGSGYFYAAQDADSFATPEAVEPEEGDFYVWSYAELESLLSNAELQELQQQFTVTVDGNFEGRNVLQRRHPGFLSATVETALEKLFTARYGSASKTLTTFPPAKNNDEAKTGTWAGRIPPVTDTKMIVAWNSLMISGLARAATVFGKSDYLKLATRAAQFILNNQWVDGRFHRLNYERQPAVIAQSEDYALFIKALLDLHQASLTQSDLEFWLKMALKVQTEFDEYLWSLESGGYYNASRDSSQDLLVRERSYVDNATPAANGVAVANLVRLAVLSEDLQYLDKAEQTLIAFSSIMNRTPQSCPSLFTGLDWYQHHTLAKIAGDLNSLSQQYWPAGLFKVEELPAGVVGMVCRGLSCQEPATSVEQLLQQLQASQCSV
jgi:uncharacterized protein YyaL (SSP411 family)